MSALEMHTRKHDELVDAFLRRHGVSFHVDWLNADDGMNHWRTRFRANRKQLTLPFSTGFGIKGEPTARMVLSAVVEDNQSVEDDDFEDIYDVDDPEQYRQMERARKLCQRQYDRYHEFFGSLDDASAVLDALDAIPELDAEWPSGERTAAAEAKFAEEG